MPHALGLNQWRVRLDDNIILLAEVTDIGSRIEGVHLDLVDRGLDERLGSEELAKLTEALSALLDILCVLRGWEEKKIKPIMEAVTPLY